MADSGSGERLAGWTTRWSPVAQGSAAGGEGPFTMGIDLKAGGRVKSTARKTSLSTNPCPLSLAHSNEPYLIRASEPYCRSFPRLRLL